MFAPMFSISFLQIIATLVFESQPTGLPHSFWKALQQGLPPPPRIQKTSLNAFDQFDCEESQGQRKLDPNLPADSAAQPPFFAQQCAQQYEGLEGT